MLSHTRNSVVLTAIDRALYQMQSIASFAPAGHAGVVMTKRIMVADDNLSIRRALRNILEFGHDWKVDVEAMNGREAVEKAKQLHPDLIVLDVSMPLMSGLEAARELRRIMPATPVILCSLHTNEILQRQASAVGVTAVVSKMQNMQMLVRKATELLQVP